MIGRLFLGLTLLCGAGGCATAQAIATSSSQTEDACVVPPTEKARLLALPYNQFDADSGQFSWRSLNHRKCTDQALKLLKDYTAARSADLTVDQRSEAAFHAGQALTFANRNQEAIPYFEKALATATKVEWSTYVAAHLAYTRGDLATLRRTRDLYATISPGSMRLSFVNGLLACPRRPYMEAAHCGQ